MSERRAEYGIPKVRAMTIRDVWEKYKHLDHMFSDDLWMPDTPMGQVLYDLWGAVKAGAMCESMPEALAQKLG